MDRKIAILGDIHANLEALNAVVEDARARAVTDFVCVGDVVGYNASPSECIRIVQDLCSVIIRGNHDHYCSYDENLDDFQPLAASVIAWTRRQLSADDAAWLRDLPLRKPFAGVTLVHSTLDVPERWGYVFDTLSAVANFSYQMTPLCFHGHTHVPMVYEKQSDVRRSEPHPIKVAFGTKYFINVGSVGQPRDGNPDSSYVIYCTKAREIDFIRVPYDVQASMEKNIRAGLPERLAYRLAQGR
ncbi:MAG: metallophosphatase family protein [Kiritimatiellaeota bacterium]|nr:metallophosphatase family protein [Kiritimatiellota bacterium]